MNVLPEPVTPKKRLVAYALLDAVGKLCDCLRLVARWLVRRDDLERRVGQANLRQLAFHFQAFDILKMR